MQIKLTRAEVNDAIRAHIKANLNKRAGTIVIYHDGSATVEIAEPVR